MKTKKLLHSVILSVLCVGLSSCGTNDTQSASAAYAKYGGAVRPAVALAGRAVLLLAVAPQDRADVAADMYAISSVVRALSYGTTPTPEQLQASIALATPKAKEWTDLSTTIFGLYGGLYPSIKGDPKLILQVLGDIADGCSDAAGGFFTAALPSPSP